MDFSEMKKTGGQTYGDFDVLVDLGEEYLCIEVKTSPRPRRPYRWTEKYSKGLLSL